MIARMLALLGLIWAVSGSASGHAQSNQGSFYRIEREKVESQGKSEDRLFVSRKTDADGKTRLYVTVQFKILKQDGLLADDILPTEIQIREDGKLVEQREIHAPSALNKLTTMLAIDTSGSMAEHDKIEEARHAARTFLDSLHAESQVGLILFDHRLLRRLSPGKNHEVIRSAIDAAVPGGGTAYLDASLQAIKMLRGERGRRAVLVMTDGVDLNSQANVDQVIREANGAEIPVYTIGVGEVGRRSPVSTVVVMDTSGSMREPAGDGGTVSKVVALKRSAARFIEIMRSGARTALLPFNTTPSRPTPFSEDKQALQREILGLRAGGETAFFDALGAALRHLDSQPEGDRKSIVAMTDGIDNKSRATPRQVIAAAREAGIPLHIMGLGRSTELNEPVMRELAERTGGTYHHAGDEKSLFEIFEKVAIQLYDEGIDEPTLKRLAHETGGKYFHAQDISKLRFIYQGLADELQNTYSVTFPSLRQEYDGTARDIDVSIWRRGNLVSDIYRGGYNVSGVVVPEMDSAIYLSLLALIGGLLSLPALLRSLAARRTAA